MAIREFIAHRTESIFIIKSSRVRLAYFAATCFQLYFIEHKINYRYLLKFDQTVKTQFRLQKQFLTEREV